MYKTVRKGDTSLQYTILPQTDQLVVYPQTSGKTWPRIVKYTMGAVMVLICMSCVATPFLIHQNDYNFFNPAIVLSQMDPIRNTSISQTQDIVVASKNKSRVSTTDVTKRNDLDQDGTTSMNEIVRDEEGEAVDDFMLTELSSDAPETSTQRPPSMEASAGAHQTTTTSTMLPSTTTTIATTISVSSTNARASSSGTTESIKTVSSKKPKMPRVTLKLRENETIPQMYMKAGIASYKKGNITTSVLAHGLSLEGLIFKTPEGTIKPWPHKWYFNDPADFQWKGSAVPMPVAIYIVLAGLAAFASISIFLMFYVHRKTSNRQWPDIEQPEIEEHEEDKSTLLGAESQEAEEKE